MAGAGRGAYHEGVPRLRHLLLTLWMALAVQPAAAASDRIGADSLVPAGVPVEVDAAPAPTLPADWISASGPGVTVHGAGADAPTVRRLAEHAATAIPALSERLGVPFGAAVDVVLAPDDATFAALQPGHTPDWADGTAWPDRGWIYLHAPSARRGDAAPLEQVLDHELVHVLVGRAFGGRPVPRWLQEGLAQYYAGELGPRTAEVLTRAAGTGALLPLRRIAAGFPSDALGAQLAYAQTADFVAFLAQRAGGGAQGDAVLRRLLAAGQRGALLSDAVVAATGQSLELTESQWRARWQSPWVRVDGLAQSGLPALAATVLLGVGVYRRRRRFHEGLARLEAEEAREAAARAAPPRVLDGYRWRHPVAES